MKPAKELTREEIAPALAEAQGMVPTVIDNTGSVYLGYPFAFREYNPLTDNRQFLELTLNPEIHAGMIDVLDEWFGFIYKENNGERYLMRVDYWHNPEYLQDIRLWQLRACVEFLRRQK